ncbi:MAG: hypothetical protein K0R93_3001 [Anaerosolibacter sp.]|jgi:hypothetical protein|nr:hypothetical protein [Anaerosolibacter sp.]
MSPVQVNALCNADLRMYYSTLVYIDITMFL